MFDFDDFAETHLAAEFDGWDDIERDGWSDDWSEMDDVVAHDAYVLASMGWGTDEDYNPWEDAFEMEPPF